MSISAKASFFKPFLISLCILLFNFNTINAQTVLDASIEQLTAPLAPHNNELESVKIRIKNKGNVAISSVSIKWKINGVFQTTNTSTNVTIPAASSLNINPTAEITMPVGTIPDNLTNVYEFYIERVNGSLSSITNNDTLRVQFTAPISGVKTIGATASDFKTIAEAVNAIRYNGIAGDLKFRIKQGKYYDPIILLASEIYFSNTTNPKIQFESFSNIKDVEIITDKTIKSSVLFNGIKNATVRNLKIKNTCEFIGIGIQYFNQANNGLVYNCEVSVDSISNTKAFAGICFGEIGAAPSFSIIQFSKVNYARISNCKISGGTYGILAAAYPTLQDTLNQIDSNEIRQVSHYGILVQNQINSKVNKNKITFRSSADVKSVGIFLSGVRTISPGIITISQNYIRGAGFSGIYLAEVLGIGFPVNRLVDISNNMIAGGFFSNATIASDVPKGIYLMNSGSINVYFNSVVMDAPVNKNATDLTSALYLNGTPSIGIINVMNNNLINKNAGYAYYNASPTGQSPVLNTDFNNYWVEKLDTTSTTTNGFAFWDNAVRVGLQALQIANNRDKKSISVNPQFLSEENLHSYSAALNQKGSTVPLTTVGVDFDGDLREQFGNPDIGADEIYTGGEDFAIVDVNPKVFKLNQPTPWQITLGYYGPTNGNKTLYYRYKIDGVDMLDPDSAIAIANTGLTNYNSIVLNVPSNRYINRINPNSFRLTVYIYAGNIGDLRGFNDTFSVDVCMGMEGLYTLDPKATGLRNFQSFSDLFQKLQCGISGPTTIEIAEGTYNERLIIGAIPNASALNTINFTSKTKNPSRTIITSGEGTENRFATITLNGAKYININNLCIENKAQTYGSAIQLTGNAQYNIIENNIIRMDTVIAIPSINLNAIISSKLGTSTANRLARNASYNLIKNNTIIGGNIGIYMNGLDTNVQDNGNRIERNTISAFRTTGIELNYLNAQVLNNIINGKGTPDEGRHGMLLIGMGDGSGKELVKIDGNRISNVYYYGISMSACNGFKNHPTKKYSFLITNNIISGYFNSNSSTPGNIAGLYLQNSNSTMILFNTILVDAPRTNSLTPLENVARCLRVANTCNDIEVHNNILYSTAGSIPLDYYVKTTGSSYSGLVASNNNLFYTSYTKSLNSPLILILKNTNTTPTKTIYSYNQNTQTPYNALLDFTSNSSNAGRESKSVAFPITFENYPYDLHTYDLQIEGLANRNFGISTDFDLQKRSFTPDLGADEIPNGVMDLALTNILNNIVSTQSPNTIKAEIKNRSRSAIVNQNVVLSYKLYNSNNIQVASSSDTIILSLNVSAGYTHTFKNNVSLTANTIYSICVDVVLPFDTVFDNNTKCKNLCTGVEGDIYVGFNKSNPIAGTDTSKYFNTITQALASIYCGIANNTTIYLNPLSSPYVERVSIPKYELSINNPTLTIKPYNTTNNSAVVIENTNVGSSDYLHHIIQLNGANNVRLENLKIVNNFPDFGSGIHFTNNAKNNLVKNCIIEVKKINPGDLYYGIAFTSANKLDVHNALAASYSGNNNTIDSNTIIGGTAGIAILGKSDIDNSDGNIIKNNTITDYYKYGILMRYSSNFEISNNYLSPSVFSTTLIKSIAIYNTINGGLINANKLNNIKSEGIKVLSVYANATKPLLISNNIIVNNLPSSFVDSTGVIAIKKSSYVYVYNNSIRYNGLNYALNLSQDSIYVSSQNKYYYYDISNVKVMNNIVYVDSSTASLPKPRVLYYNSNSTSNYLNYNAYYSQYVNLFARTRSLFYNTFSNWRISTGRDANSMFEPASYISTNDLNLSNRVQFVGRGVPIPIVPRDFENKIRNPRVGSIGAYEYYTSSRNLSVLSLGINEYKYGQNEISCYLINEGEQNISLDSVELQYSIDTGQSWIGNQIVRLDSLDKTYDVQFVKFNLKYNKTDFITQPLWVRINPIKRLPNDTSIKLETYGKLLCVGLRAGEYTLSKNNPNADFSSIQQIINALHCGFNGNVVINIEAGTYEEDLFFGDLPSDPNKSITFKGVDNALVEWKTLSSTKKSIVELFACENITFNNITFKGVKTNDFVAVHLLDSLDNIKFINCKFNMPKDPSVFQVYAISTLRDNPFTRSRAIKNIRIENCTFEGGNTGINIKSNHQADKRIDIIHSTFKSIYSNAININAANIDSISFNTIDLKNSGVSSFGIKLGNLNQPFSITNNKILNCSDESILIDSSYSLYPAYVLNNMLVSSTNRDALNSNVFTIKNYGVNPLRNIFKSAELLVAFNSMSHPDMGSTSNESVTLNIDKSNGLSFVGNIITNHDKSFAIKLSTGNSDSTELLQVKHNLLYTNGTTLAEWRNVSCSTLSVLGTQDGGLCPFNIQNSPKGLGSFSPKYRSPFDLHANDVRLNAAIPILSNSVPTFVDIDGELFSSNNIDIGCDQFTMEYDLAVTGFINPVENQSFLGNDIEVKVRLENKGINLPYVNIRYEVDGKTIDSLKYLFTPMLQTDSVIQFSFPKKYSTLRAGNHVVKVFAEVREQRGTEYAYVDFNKMNDTMSVQFITIDSADLRVQSFISPTANAIINTPTNVVLRIANKGTTTISKYKVVLLRNNQLQKEINIDGTNNISPNFFKDVPIDFTIIPTENNMYEYCAYTVLFEDFDHSNDTTCISISTAVGINKIEAEFLQVYPNPVNDVLMFNSTENLDRALISIYNTLGQKIAETVVNNNYADVSKLVPGAYIFTVMQEGILYRGKFLK